MGKEGSSGTVRRLLLAAAARRRARPRGAGPLATATVRATLGGVRVAGPPAHVQTDEVGRGGVGEATNPRVATADARMHWHQNVNEPNESTAKV